MNIMHCCCKQNAAGIDIILAMWMCQVTVGRVTETEPMGKVKLYKANGFPGIT